MRTDIFITLSFTIHELGFFYLLLKSFCLWIICYNCTYHVRFKKNFIVLWRKSKLYSWHLEIQLLIKTWYLLIFLNFSITLLIYVELFMLIVIAITSLWTIKYLFISSIYILNLFLSLGSLRTSCIILNERSEWVSSFYVYFKGNGPIV